MSARTQRTPAETRIHMRPRSPALLSLLATAFLAATSAALLATVWAGTASAQGASTIASLEADKARLIVEKRELEETYSSQLNAMLHRLDEVRSGLPPDRRLGRSETSRLEENIRYWSNREKFEAIIREIGGLRELSSLRDSGYSASLDSGTEVCRADLRNASTRMSALESDKSRLIEQNRDLQDSHGAHLVSALSTVIDLKHQLARKLGQPTPGVLTSIDAMRQKTNGQKYESVVAELDSLRRMIADASLHCERRAEAISPDLMRLRDRMAAQMRTDDYDVSTYPDNELIRGRRGRYYVIDMKDATAKGVRFQFEPGKYTISTRQEQFRAALSKFAQEILEKVQGKVDYQILVRGSADASTTFRGRLDPGHEYRNIRFMRNLGGDRYVNEFSAMRIDGPTIQNSDLPNLRAAFLQETVAKVYPLNEPVILEGSVTNKVDQSDRNVELMLYINW